MVTSALPHADSFNYERKFPLQEAIRLATGREVSQSQAQKLRLTGVSGVKLESAREFGRRVTSIEAIRRMNAAITAMHEPRVVLGTGPKHRQQADDLNCTDAPQRGLQGKAD
jgi:hypothetical protein